MKRDIEREYMKRSSIAIVMDQLKLRGEDVMLADKLSRYDIIIKDKSIKIRVKFTKPIQRSRCIEKRWEFNKLIHRSRLYPVDIFDYYLLVGFNDNGSIAKIWKISAEDKIIYRKNQIFIPVEDNEIYKEYEMYELKILDDIEENDGIKWIG